MAGGVLTKGHFIELVTIGGVVAGVLDNGQFTALLTDARGTPFAGSDGAPGLASPYGARASHLHDAEVIDYARLGWDPDLDIIRMGVRDYDPKLSQFLTPDPLYFENLDKCRESPLQCALYGYASGNPLSFVDPIGMDSTGMRYIQGKEDFDADKVISVTQSIAAGVGDAKDSIGTIAHRAKDLIDDVVLQEDLQQFARDLFDDTAGAADAFNQTVDNVFFHPDRLVCPNGDCVRGTTSLLVGALASEMLGEGTAVAKSSRSGAGDLPGNALVCRGGTCEAARFEQGSRVTIDASGRLQGVSVNSAPGATLQQLTETIKNRQVGVSTIEDVRAVGGSLTPTPTPNNPFHCTLNDSRHNELKISLHQPSGTLTFPKHNMEITEEELAEIQARSDRAAPGPWTSIIEGRDHTSGSSFIMVGPPTKRREDMEISGASADDLDFIAHARQDVPRLLNEVRQLRAMCMNK